MNLLKETKEILKAHGKKLSDITFVQGNSFGMSVEKFIEIADTEYSHGYGAAKVAQDLIVGGEGWWLERAEYDGAEWWEYKEYPSILPIKGSVYALTINQSKEDISCGWETLASINGIGVEKNDI